MRIPEDVANVLRTLSDAGYSAWCVGGCVRDLLLGRHPDDWDVTTAARPEETQRLFPGRAVPTGLHHGTVTVRTGLRPVEVTTYRRDGAYADHRHPDQVTFSDSLEEDLSRRDFTVNAMALGADGTVRDPFGGAADLAAGTLRCVGEPSVRFGEDALRILRCLRFAAVLGFSVEERTALALRRDRGLLTAVAAERIRTELVKLLTGVSAGEILLRYPDVIGVFLPELLPAVGFDQRNRHHCFDVWEHTVRSVEAAPPEPLLRMTLLLHDLGKPACFSVDEKGCGHFYGHPKVSWRIAQTVLERLRFDRREQGTILTLVANHDRNYPRTRVGALRALNALGEKNARLLLQIKRADNLAQAPEYRASGQAELDRFEVLMDEVLREDTCFSLRQLAVNGRDLTALGLSGPQVGQTLRALLDGVVEGRLANRRDALLAAAKQGVPGKSK
ncbi:MAG: HD domain-containing protein [Oscillibacter sp.]|jgi:tRNA nucleotidyltransferase (CCA-adding enzyme)|nr:HD domain-containing protein [Oscillibacter sp.]